MAIKTFILMLRPYKNNVKTIKNNYQLLTFSRVTGCFEHTTQ